MNDQNYLKMNLRMLVYWLGMGCLYFIFMSIFMIVLVGVPAYIFKIPIGEEYDFIGAILMLLMLPFSLYGSYYILHKVHNRFLLNQAPKNQQVTQETPLGFLAFIIYLILFILLLQVVYIPFKYLGMILKPILDTYELTFFYEHIFALILSAYISYLIVKKLKVKF